MGDICKIVSGSTPSTKEEIYWNGDINFCTLVDLKEKYISYTSRTITEMGRKSKSIQLLPINSIIFSSRATIGKTAINRIPLCTNQGFKSFICNPLIIDYEYLYYWFLENIEEIKVLGSGLIYPEINTSIFSKLKISLPPLGVQRSIINEQIPFNLCL